MLGLVRAMGVEPAEDLRLYTSESNRAWLSTQACAIEPYAVLAPTSRWAGKQWPADRFTLLARRLLAHGVRRVVIVGGPGEAEQISPLLAWAESEPRAFDLVGRTEIGHLMAMIERAELVVANDSAALHMAVGFGRPLVALFGPTRAELVGPFGRGRDVIQHLHDGDRFDHKDAGIGTPMMERIGVDEVVEACVSRLAIV